MQRPISSSSLPTELELSENNPEFAKRTELLEQLLQIGIALSDTQELSELLNLILEKSRLITCSDAGSVYLVDYTDEYPKLLFKAAQNDSLPQLSFQEFAIPLTKSSLAGYVASTGESLNIPDAYNLPLDVPYHFAPTFDQDIGYHTRSVLVLPMQDRQRQIIGVLQLINRKVNADVKLTPEITIESTQPYSEWEERIVRSLASQAAISIERNQLIESIENLFKGFVKASVQAIEARDPCTSGHSERVAELTVRLAEELNDVNHGPLATVRFSDKQLQEVRYAALLHDFGKIGVPEGILTKRKKLYPEQLNLIRERFHVAQRTLQLKTMQAKYQYLQQHFVRPTHSPTETAGCFLCQNIEQLDQKLDNLVEQLDKYWQALLEANEPRVLAEKPLSVLQQLSQYQYQDVDGKYKPLVTADEMVQLMVLRGNLTPDERKLIESHVTHSYEFLKSIPWTKELQYIPEIAYGHHEKLDGSGYPRGLKEKDIPIQSQIMVIADIYDALTAGDRPYKQGVSPDFALKILWSEAGQYKINSQILELFEGRQVFSILGHCLETELQSV